MLGLCYDSGKGAELFICKAEEAEGMDTKEIAMRWLSENLNYVDSVTVIDSTGRIIAKQRFNPRYTDEENLAHNQWALGKNLLELFPSLSPEDSTLLQVLHTGKIIYIENQEAWNLQGRKTVCNNWNSHHPNLSPVISGYKQPSKSAQSIEITGFIEKSKPPKIIFFYTLLPLTA